jgi:hypothetical protein
MPLVLSLPSHIIVALDTTKQLKRRDSNDTDVSHSERDFKLPIDKFHVNATVIVADMGLPTLLNDRLTPIRRGSQYCTTPRQSRVCRWKLHPWPHRPERRQDGTGSTTPARHPSRGITAAVMTEIFISSFLRAHQQLKTVRRHSPLSDVSDFFTYRYCYEQYIIAQKFPASP